MFGLQRLPGGGGCRQNRHAVRQRLRHDNAEILGMRGQQKRIGRGEGPRFSGTVDRPFQVNLPLQPGPGDAPDHLIAIAWRARPGDTQPPPPGAHCAPGVNEPIQTFLGMNAAQEQRCAGLIRGAAVTGRGCGDIDPIGQHHDPG